MAVNEYYTESQLPVIQCTQPTSVLALIAALG